MDWPTRAAAVGLLRAAHPLPSVAVTGIACAFAAALGRGAAGTLGVGMTVLSSQLVIGWDNDYRDRHRDAAAGRLDKPLVTGAVPARAVLIAAVVAGVGFVTSLFAHPLAAGLVAVLATASAAAYNHGLKASVISPVPYAVSFGLLPAFVTLGAPAPGWPPVWIVIAAVLLGAGAHFANALPDIADDLATGVRGLPARLGARRSALCAAALLAPAGAVLAIGSGTIAEPAGALVIGTNALLSAAIVGWAMTDRPRRASPARTERTPWPFYLAVALAGIDVALLIGSGAALGRR